MSSHLAIEMGTPSYNDEWLPSLMNEVDEDPEIFMGPTIPKVPSTFREVQKNRDCYDPLVVSIGPYHHGEKRLEGMEKLKGRLACQFVKRSRAAAVEIHSEVKKLVHLARGCYTLESTAHLNDEKLAQMMFLDGCFILQFLICKPENLKMKSEDAALVTRDLFLLENQLPFQVLITLMTSRFGDIADGRMKLFEDFLFEDFFKHIRAIPPRAASCRENMSNLLRRLARTFFSTARKFDGEPQPFHLLGLFHSQFVSGSTRENIEDYHQERSEVRWNQFFPYNELKKLGINFKPSNTSLFSHVVFKKMWLVGELYVPPLTVVGSTKSVFMNLVAYEACNKSLASDWFTSYVCFMHSLIDRPEDVKELRSDGILLNTIGSDHQVVELFKDMATNLTANSDTYIEVKSAIESYYINTFTRWINHYKGPISSALVKYSFLYGFVASAIEAYVSATQPKSGCGSCISPATNSTRHL